MEVRRPTQADVPAIAAIINAWIDETSWMDRDVPPEEIEAMILYFEYGRLPPRPDHVSAEGLEMSKLKNARTSCPSARSPTPGSPVRATRSAQRRTFPASSRSGSSTNSKLRGIA